jgi:DNA (cytosine-5)-methyltransferase 1
MRCGHLFNGIGGFALAAAWMKWENVMHCEIDPFCNRVMNHHFPNSYQHEDTRTTDFRIWRGKIDLLTGGFPCQPASTAGKRSGKADDRWLWPETKRAIVEIRPRIVVLENVNGLVSLLEPVSFTEVESQAVQFYNREHLLFKLEHKKRDKIEIGLKAIQERLTAQIIKEIEAEGYLLPRTKEGG